MYISVFCVLCISVMWHNLCLIKFWPSWTKYCLNRYSLTQVKVAHDSNDPCWHEQDYIQPPYHHSIYCRHRSDGPHLCEDVRLYPDGNLNTSVCLLPSFLIYVSLKRLIIDGASIVMSMLSTLHREQPNCTSPCSNFLFWSYLHIYEFPKIINRWHQFSQRQDHWVFWITRS